MAIPISELRIGNMFWEDYGGYKIVTAIGFNNVGEFPNHVQGRAIGYKVSGLFDADKIDPIPLTPEVLKSCGFYIDSDGMWKIPFHECGLYWLETKMQLTLGGMPMINFDCTTLHQLQNLYFALSGKELTYNKP